MTAGVCALLVAGLLVSGCASDSEREWRVAANPRATADEIIDAGHAVGIATNGDQMVVTWEVEPEDDEGPYQGAWRLYDREPLQIAEGTFGTVREASARIDVTAVRGGFLLTDYAKHRLRFLNREGELTPAALNAAKPGSSLVGGVLRESRPSDEEGWEVVLPDKHQIVRLTDLPTEDVQGVALTEDGTVWVLLPWKDDGPFRVAYAKNGRAPWTTEVIPLPKGSATGGDGFSASGGRLFVVGSHSKGEKTAVEVILSRSADDAEWTTIDAAGIADNLTAAPQVTALRKGRLLASSSGEGSWVRDPHDTRFHALRPPRTHQYARPTVSSEGPWLWSAEQTFGKSLYYSYDFGKTWRKFYR
jgi:hypothetical protein